MRRGARNHDGQLSLPGVGALPNKLLRPKGAKGGAHGRLVSAIIEWSELPTIARLLVLTRTPAGLFVLRGRGVVRGAKAGTSDITGRTTDGRVVAIEVKVGRDTLRADQRVYLQGVIRDNGWAFVARSIEQISREVHEAFAGRYVPSAEIFAA